MDKEKETQQEQLPAIIQHMLDRISNKHYYIIKNTFHFIKLDLDDVYYIHKSSKNAVIYTKHGIYEERKSLEQLLKDLPENDRLDAIAQHIVYHFPRRGFRGKGMVISVDKFTTSSFPELIIEISLTGSTPFSTWVTLSSAKQRTTCTIASTSRI